MQARSTRSPLRRGVAFASLLLALPTLCTAQRPAPANAVTPIPAQLAAQSATQFAAEPVVIERMQLVFSYNPDGTGFREQTFAVRIGSDATLRSFSVLGIPFAGNSERVHFLYARVRHADGSVVETAPDTAIEQAEQVTREAPLYSDLKQQQLPIKSLGVGDTLEWQVHIDRTKAEAPGEFWGRQNLVTDGPVLSESVELRVPSARHVHVWTNPQTKIAPKITTEGDQQVYRWSTTSLTTTVGPEAEAARKAKAKTVLNAAEQIDALQGKLPDVAWTSFASWDAVGAWYRSLEAGRTEPNPAITAKVNELTAGKTNLEDRIRAVYAYVSGQIHYIGVDFGVGRYQPHLAAEVLDNQYGDCKDKHTLLAAMLTVLGVHADAVLIGSNLRFNPAVPAPDSFNHLITHVRLDGGEVWLDSTTEVAPYRMLFVLLRDKDALLVPDVGPAAIAHTPVDPPFPTFEKMTAAGSIDAGGTSESHFTFTQRGDEELLIRMVLRQVTPAQYDELTQRLVANMGFGGTVSHARFTNINDTAKPLVTEWDYHREKAGNDWDNLRTVPQVMMVLLPTIDEKDPPLQDIHLYGAREVTATSEMKLPAGWSAELPEAVHTKSAFGTYDLTYRYTPGVVYADRHWTVLKATVPQTDWKQYKTWIDTVAPGTEPYVQLRRASAEKPATGSATLVGGAELSPKGAPGAPPDPAAETNHLMDQAYTAVVANRLDEGKALLDKVQTLDPQKRNLWQDYGWIEFKRGNHPEAMRLYAKEIDTHPDTEWAYTSLSQLQLASGDRDAATKTMHRRIAQVPENPDPRTSLINMMLGADKPINAAIEADAALAQLPAEAQAKTDFQMAVIAAELRGGKVPVGVALATRLLSANTDPLVSNNVVYELALSGQQLSLAEATERGIVETLTAESQTWTLDESMDTLMSRSSLLTASWDTLGWIFYRERKYAEAEPFLSASWHNQPREDVGEHLGDAQLALGQKAAALHTFQLALGTLSQYDAMGVRRTSLSLTATDLLNRILALKGDPDTPMQLPLQAMRTFSLPASLDHDGVAKYKLLVTADGVAKAEPTSSHELAGGAALLRRAKLPASLFPSGSEAQLMKLGTLNCHAGTCELVLQP